MLSDQEYEDDERDINRGFRQLPSRSAHRSFNTSTRRRGSGVRRGSGTATQDVEVVNIEDLADDLDDDDLVDPKRINQPMSAKRRYK